MKKNLIITGILVLFATVAFASPFLICDPMSDATNYRMRLSVDNGVTWGDWVEGPPVNQAMRFDLQNVPRNNYRGEAQAFGSWTVTDSTTGAVSTVTQWTPSAPFLLETPSSMENVRIER